MIKKYAAVFEVTSWLTEQYLIKGDDAFEILSAFEDIQSLSCLVRMGRREEDVEGQKQLDKIEALLDKKDCGELNIDDLKTMDYTLSLGDIRCLDVLEGESAEAVLREKYPKVK